MPHMMAVKIPNSSDSNSKKIRNIVVAAGEKVVHSKKNVNSGIQNQYTYHNI